VFVSLFASNVHRLRLLGEIARASNRRVVLCGRSIQTHSRVATDTGYLEWPSDLTWPRDRVRELPRDRVLALVTGTQGEARGALARLAWDDFPGVSIEPGDTVVLSSRVIPGNERQVFPIVDQLLRRGARVRSWVTDRAVHVSGHAHRPDQRRMLELVRPRLFVPVHGTYHHLTRHADLARAAGVEQALVLENGELAECDGRVLRKVGKVQSGRTFVHEGREVAPSVVRQRGALAEEGVVVVVVVQGARDEVRISTRGVVDEALDARLIEEAAHEARAAVARAGPGDATEEVRLAVRRVFFRATGTKPTTLVTVVSGRA
jgi:ribonuclease J